MRFPPLVLVSLISFALPLHSQEQALCDTHDWFSANPEKAVPATSLLCKGVLDSSFEHRKQARAELLQVVANAPQSPESYRAHEVLTSMYFRAGQYGV